jgi:SAM-dependent methyltransferase
MSFDKYSNNYTEILRENLGMFGRDIAYYAEYKIKIILRNIVSPPNSILDYGCGIGRTIPFLSEYFPNAEIWGCDISEESLNIAEKLNRNQNFFSLNDNEFTNQKQFFDLILVANVFHHIAPEMRLHEMRKIKGFLKSSGELFVFEHNPYNPITRHIVNTCPFDFNALLLKPSEMKQLLIKSKFNILKKRYSLFFPAALKSFQCLESLLELIPMGGQYYFHAEK